LGIDILREMNLSGCPKPPTRSGRFSDVRGWPHFSVR
jgi:hypothetical protein